MHTLAQFPALAFGNQLHEELYWVNVQTDAEGRFSIPRLVPGLTYQLTAHASVDHVTRQFGNELGEVAWDLPAPTGSKPKDLGTITLTVKKPEPKKP